MKTSLFVILLFVACPIFAQPGNPGGDPDVPITGIEYLIALGGAYGIRKLVKSNKKTS